MLYQINIPAVKQLRKFIKQREKSLNLEMNDYITTCDPANHFCATSACLAGWGASARLQQDHPVLKPIYTKIDEWTNHWPTEKATQSVRHLLRALASIYSVILADTNYTPDVDDVMLDLNRFKVDDYHNLTELLHDVDTQFLEEDHLVHIDQLPLSPVWHFIFGGLNTDDIDHALWRMDYVIKHNDVPFAFSRTHKVASNLTWHQAVEQLKTEFPDEDMYTFITEPLNTNESVLNQYTLDIGWEFTNRGQLVNYVTKMVTEAGTTND